MASIVPVATLPEGLDNLYEHRWVSPVLAGGGPAFGRAEARIRGRTCQRIDGAHEQGRRSHGRTTSVHPIHGGARARRSGALWSVNTPRFNAAVATFEPPRLTKAPWRGEPRRSAVAYLIISSYCLPIRPTESARQHRLELGKGLRAAGLGSIKLLASNALKPR